MLVVRRGKTAAYLELLAASAIWGFAFVAQRKGLESLDPFSFNALRFGLGALFVLLLRTFQLRTRERFTEATNATKPAAAPKLHQGWILLLGTLLFVASSLQQLGLIWTSAGNAGFITGLYVVMVPLIGLCRGQKLSSAVGVSIILAVGGLWLINRAQPVQATRGNLFVLAGALFWALHVQLIDRLTKLLSSLDLALAQYTVCALGSLIAVPAYQYAIGIRPRPWPELLSSVGSAALPILYAGIFSVGVAFTLQLRGQKKVPPWAASVVLCTEGVFALLGGRLILAEPLGTATLGGAGFLLGAMLLSVLGSRKRIF